ncbi:hypothetical protein BY458DRAFT_477572, partial [Sporodiniella umbellata]
LSLGCFIGKKNQPITEPQQFSTTFIYFFFFFSFGFFYCTFFLFHIQLKWLIPLPKAPSGKYLFFFFCSHVYEQLVYKNSKTKRQRDFFLTTVVAIAL